MRCIHHVDADGYFFVIDKFLCVGGCWIVHIVMWFYNLLCWGLRNNPPWIIR